MSEQKTESSKPGPGEQQSEAVTEANKPEEARAEDKPQAGNILGGVQPKSE